MSHKWWHFGKSDEEKRLEVINDEIEQHERMIAKDKSGAVLDALKGPLEKLQEEKAKLKVDNPNSEFIQDNFVSQDAGGGIIELVKKIATTEGDNKAVGIVKNLIDKKGLPFVSNLIQSGDVANLSKAIINEDPDIAKRRAALFTDRAQEAVIPSLVNKFIPSFDPVSSGINTLNLANTGFDLAEGITENLANQDYPYVDPAFELLNTGVQSAGNMMQGFTDLGNGFYQDTFGRVFNLGQKKMVNPMMSGIRNILNLNDGRRQPDLPIVNQPVVQQSSVIDDYITSLGQSNTTQNNDGSQTISGGTTNPADDIVMTNLPKPIFQPTMADVAGPSSNNNNIQPASTPSRPAYSPQDMNIQPASAPSETNNSRNRFGRFGRANGGLVSMARVLKR